MAGGIEQNQLNLDEPLAARSASTTHPTTGTGRGVVYPFATNAGVELFFKDDRNNTIQLTENGSAIGGTGSGGSSSGAGSDFAFRNGVANPADSIGVDGDYFLNTTSGDLFEKDSGAYSFVMNVKGEKGDAGEDGSAGAQGAQGPAGNDGAPGAAGADGINGLDGTIVLFGADAPVSGLGNNGDVYFKTTAPREVFKKDSGTWDSQFVIASEGSSGAGSSLAAEEIFIQLDGGADLAARLASADTSLPAGVSVLLGDDSQVSSSIAGGNTDLVIKHDKAKICVSVAVVRLDDAFGGDKYPNLDYSTASKFRSDGAGNQVILNQVLTGLNGKRGFFRLMLVPIFSGS